MTAPQVPEAEGWFRLVVEAAPNAKLIVDAERRIVLVNRAAEILFGYDRSELVGSRVEMLIPVRFGEHHEQHVAGFFRDPNVRAMGAGRDLFGLRKDGSEVPIEIGLNPIQTSAGWFTLASIIDITERKRGEQLFRLVVEAAPNAMLVTDVRRTITLVNRKAEDLFGYSREELVGQAIDVLVPERFRAAHPANVESFFAQPRARPMGVGRDLYALRKDGSEFLVEIGLNPFDAPEGRLVMASIIDITERKHTEVELRRSNAELEQFAYIASHDLQEPLRMVASYTGLLAQRYQHALDDQADKYIHYAVDGARRMQRLVADLLAYSRVGSQGQPLVPVSSSKVVEEVLLILEPALQASGGSVEVEPLPDVLADEGQLVQLFQNLIGNAIKFRSQAAPRIHVRAKDEGRYWRFEVEDNGIGIDMQYRERIFQMFQRLHERGKYEGSGIGLSIAKRIVERHGGSIGFESAPRAGATFYFTLQPARAGQDPS